MDGAAGLVLMHYEDTGGFGRHAQRVGGEAAEVSPAQPCVAAEEEGVTDVAQTPVGGVEMLQLGELLLGQMLTTGLDLWYVDVLERVFGHAEHVALDGLVDQAA